MPAAGADPLNGGFARAPRGIFLKCRTPSSLWASESLRECLPKLAVKVTARPEFSACKLRSLAQILEFSACMQHSLAHPKSGADHQIKLWCPYCSRRIKFHEAQITIDSTQIRVRLQTSYFVLRTSSVERSSVALLIRCALYRAPQL